VAAAAVGAVADAAVAYPSSLLAAEAVVAAVAVAAVLADAAALRWGRWLRPECIS
jgi:hypothetical protein